MPALLFKRLDTRTFMYATTTFITEALCLVMLVQLLLMTVTVKLKPYTALANSYRVSIYDAYQCQGRAHQP